MITLLHIKHEASDIDRNAYIEALTSFGGVERQIAAVRKLLNQGLYCVVALIDGDDMEEAFELTQNGIRNQSWMDSWSQHPPASIIAIGGNGYHEANGRRYGYKSTSVGDIMVVNGDMYVVAGFGFEKL